MAIDCSNDFKMIREGLRLPALNIDYSVFRKSEKEKTKLKNHIQEWKKKMYMRYGDNWTKRSSNRIDKNGSRKMN